MRIVQAKPQQNFKLQLAFENGVAGEVDLSDLAGRGVFAVWLQGDSFYQVHVTETGAVEWPGEVDLCPDALYLRLTGNRPEQVFPILNNLVNHA